MTFDGDRMVRLLTMATLEGLLFSVGLRLTWAEIAGSVRRSRLGWVLPVNFLLVPALAFGLARLFQVSTDIAVAMALLAAAPFAPVVPTFTRLANGDLALAGVLTGVFPLLSAFATPVVCSFSVEPLLATGSLNFSFLSILYVLAATITLPLAAGLACHHYLPVLGRFLLKPVQTISEATGAVALIFVVVRECQTIGAIGWKPLLAMALLSELSFLAGYALSGPAPSVRRVIALGTANRNIALALLIAIESFPGTPIVAAVVANGLLLIVLGLLHVGFWRFFASPVRNG